MSTLLYRDKYYKLYMNGQHDSSSNAKAGIDMPEDYSRERLALLDALLKKRADIANGRPWTLEPGRMRFKHGESIAELKVPYHMGADDEACIDNAVSSLIALLAKRYEGAASGEGLLDGLIEGASQPQPFSQAAQPLKDKTYRTDIFITGSIEKKLASQIIRFVPYIDSAILINWFGPEGHGRRFIKWVSDLFEKTLKEEARFSGGEPTSYLALLSTLSTIRKKKERIKGCKIKGLAYEKIDLAVGMTIFLAFSGAVADMFSRLRESGAPFYNPSAELLITSAITPRAFVSIPSSILSSSQNPYGINAAIYALLEPFAAGFSNDSDAVAGLAAASSARILDDAERIDGLRQQHEIIRFRQEAVSHLMDFDIPGSEARDILYSVLGEDRLIRNLLAEPRLISGLSKALDDVRDRFVKDPAGSGSIASFQQYLASFRKSVFGGFLKSARKEEFTALEDFLYGFYAFRLDEHIERFTGAMRSYMADRRGEFSAGMLIEEYNRGRLYRFSTDDRPFLKTLALEEEGQLFIDMKDFTRKTLKVKEIAMAEFMKDYFYKPILKAASSYKVGMGVVADERGIRLTNLPGDAAIFSGGVSYLVALARDIQKITRNYRDQLMKKLLPAKDEARLEEVHKRFETRKADLKKRRAELHSAMDRKEQRVESRLVALGEEEHRLENIFRDELEAAIQGELEAGLYISYGTKAEEMVIEAQQGFTEPARVSIGEKINEAARGTSRNPLVRAKLEMLLENDRQKKKQEKRYPFDVYIDRTYSVKMPPELENAFEKLISRGTQATAQAMSKVMANEFLSDLGKIISGEPFTSLRLISASTDIYNKGQALSESALDAYIRETRGTKMFFKKTVDTADLDESIREAFFFPSGTLEFRFGVEVVRGTEQIEGFVKAGDVIFKGFEASTPVTVYEMLNPESEFFKSILKHHIGHWVEEAKKAAEDSSL